MRTAGPVSTLSFLSHSTPNCRHGLQRTHTQNTNSFWPTTGILTFHNIFLSHNLLHLLFMAPTPPTHVWKNWDKYFILRHPWEAAGYHSSSLVVLSVPQYPQLWSYKNLFTFINYIGLLGKKNGWVPSSAESLAWTTKHYFKQLYSELLLCNSAYPYLYAEDPDFIVFPGFSRKGRDLPYWQTKPNKQTKVAPWSLLEH